MKKLRSLWQGVKIKSKINLLYFSALILSFSLTFLAFSLVNNNNVEREIGQSGVQTVDVLKGNLKFIFDNVTQFSSLIYFDKNMQKSLSEIQSENINPIIQQDINKSLANMLLSGDYISSAFIFDNYDNYYSSYKVGPILVNRDLLTNSAWYQKMLKSNGDGFFTYKSEDVLNFYTRPDKNYISYVRQIADTDTYQHLATLLLTIDEETIQAYFQEAGQNYQSEFCIIDEAGHYIVKPKSNEEALPDFSKLIQNQSSGYQTIQLNGQKKILVYQDLGIQDWKIIGLMEMSGGGALSGYYRSTLILILCLNLFFVFICALVLSRLIFKPLNKVQKHMQFVENGIFVEMDVEAHQNNEITNLKRVYNQMIQAIQKLIAKVKEEEQVIAKNELEIIQAQIHPHFLYNTLDAISALALLKDNENCFKMTQALGNFYKNSLNSGMDLVSIKDEMDCIKSYMTILNIRYGNQIIVEYYIEDSLWEQRILKLILQPVVENAVHHGIKPQGGKGVIQIKAYSDSLEIVFVISDDGVGMSEEQIQKVMTGKMQTGKSGFGLYSLIQRIALYYGISKPVTITSEKGGGTVVTIRILMLGGERNDKA